MTTEKIVSNYTPEQTANAVIDYLAGTSVELIAERLGKSARSVIAKLSREKVYVAKAKMAGAKSLTKAALVTQIEVLKELAPGTLVSLEKADKPALEALLRTM
jgi:transposase